MPFLTAPQRYVIRTTELRLISVSFNDVLETGESFTGTPTVVDTPADLTVANIAISSTEKTLLGVPVPAGRVISFTVTGGTADTTYTLVLRGGTDASPAQTIEGDVILEVQ